ncbi:MAG: hypothetical protein WBN96_05290 [Gammaproteobacteria bacterium]
MEQLLTLDNLVSLGLLIVLQAVLGFDKLPISRSNPQARTG